MRVAAAAGTKLTTVQTRVLVLLAISVCINYIDRGTLSVAAPQLTRELSLDPKQMGVLLSCFFWTYSLCQIVAGWLVDRYDVRWVFGVGENLNLTLPKALLKACERLQHSIP